MKIYDNYIFDLYGTLLDIRTDEKSIGLWRFMADFYSVYGCDWEAKEMRKTYLRMDEEERRKRLTEEITVPEIPLEIVFIRLLFECEKSHDCGQALCGEPIDALRKVYPREKDKLLESLSKSDFAVAAANVFRIRSRKYVYPYKNTISTLDALKKNGKRLFLLSNAQRIFTMPEIERTGLMPYFHQIYISSDYDMKKPQSAFLEILLKEQRLERTRCVMVGNEIGADMQIADDCGIAGIYLHTGQEPRASVETQARRLARQPEIVWSGDIAEILSDSETDNETGSSGEN